MKNKILKEAVVLLIAATMLLSTVVVMADTNTNQAALNTINKGSAQGARGDIVWDNGMNYDGLLAAQEPVTTGNLDCYPADDFHFEEDTEVCDVHWIGGYWNGDPEPWDWCISFMYDDGSGNAPDSHPLNPSFAGPFCYAWEDINKEEIEPGYYEMWVYLPENIPFPGCYKFWISIWAVGDSFPQSGWGYHQDPITMHETVLRSDYFGVPDWTDTSELLGYAVDQCFQLTQKEDCNPSIDVEKYVWDPETQEWIDADTEDEAVDFAKCSEITFKIVITNTGDCALYDIKVSDKMHDTLEFLAGDPEPDEWWYEEPDYHLFWFFDVLDQTESKEIYVTAHVAADACSLDYNYVLVEATCEHGKEVRDDDWCWIHSAVSRTILQNRLLARFFERFPNMFPLLQQLLAL